MNTTETRREPWPHQTDALSWASRRNPVGFLMEMRLGKCLVAVRHVTGLPQFNRVGRNLIVCPAEVMETWREELEAEGLGCTLLRPPFENRMQSLVESPHHWFVVNYQGLFVPGQRYESGRTKIVPTPIATLPWQSVVLDEADLISNPQAQTTKVVLGHLSAAPIRVILSGELNPESLLQYYCPMSFLNGGQGFMGCHDWWSFRQATHKPWGPYKWEPQMGMSKQIRDAVDEHCFRLTRKDAGVFVKTVVERRYVDLPAGVRRIYDKLENDFELPEKGSYGSREKRAVWLKHAVAQRTHLCKIAGGQPPDIPKARHAAKLKALMALLDGELRGQRAVIWFRFNSELRMVLDALKAKGYRAAPITGVSTPEDRTRRRHKFNDGKLDYLCVQIKCGRYGLNLSGADTAIVYSLTESRRDWIQLRDRIVHVRKAGGTGVLIVKLLARDTVDEDIDKAQGMKGLNATTMNSGVLEAMAERLDRKRDKA